MSFSSDVKGELNLGVSSSKHCKLAELAAMVIMTGKFKDDKWQEPEDNHYVSEKSKKLIKMLDLDIGSQEGKLSLKLVKGDRGYTIDNMLIERSCCKQAFLRGAFLAAGSVTNPEKGYHFEIVCDDERQSDILSGIIKAFGVEAKIITRKKYYWSFYNEKS